MNELNRYERLYSTLANPYFSMILDSQETIPTLAEKTIKENMVSKQVNDKYALNLRVLRNFIQA